MTTKRGESDKPCESCGDIAALTPVRRVYVTPAAWDEAPSVRPAEIERWCQTCIAHYPHQAVEEG